MRPCQILGLLLLWLSLGNEAVLADPVPDLTQAAQELAANLQELRRNLNSWEQLQRDPSLPAAAKNAWRERARAYLQACLEYENTLAGLPAAKLSLSPAGQRILELRQTFRRERQFFTELLEKP